MGDFWVVGGGGDTSPGGAPSMNAEMAETLFDAIVGNEK